MVGADPLRVLCVDDNPDIATSTADFLSLVGFSARHAFGGPQALAIAREFRPHVCLLDINMPEMNGYELARALRAELGRVFLVAITAAYGSAHDGRLVDAGFDRCLVKPASPEALFAILRGVPGPASDVSPRPSPDRHGEPLGRVDPEGVRSKVS